MLKIDEIIEYSVVDEIIEYSVVVENTMKFAAALSKRVQEVRKRGIKNIEIQYSTSVVGGTIYQSALIIGRK